MNKIMKSMDVKVEIKELRVRDVKTTYQERIWVKDKNHPEGGSYQNIEMYYDSPRVMMSFMATVDKDLVVGNVYTDGLNTFVAATKRSIVLQPSDVKIFEIPEKLTLVSSQFNG